MKLEELRLKKSGIHSLSLPIRCRFVICWRNLGEFVPEVEMIGIQPEVVAFGYPLSTRVTQAVESVYQSLRDDRIPWDNLE